MSDPSRARSAVSEIGGFKALLPVWVAGAIGAGVAAGAVFPAAFAWLRIFEVDGVNLLIAALVWLMIFPTMVQVDFSRLAHAPSRARGLVLTVAINWLVKPFTMAALATFFLVFVFNDLLPAGEARGYVAGLVLLGAAPCTGMVFAWSRLTGGDATFTVVQVAVNDLVLVVAFAPLVALLLGVAEVPVPWPTLFWATSIFVLLPLVAGVLVRGQLLARGGEGAVQRFVARFAPLTRVGLLLLVGMLFGIQADRVLGQPQAVLLIAVPLLIQTYAIFVLAFAWAWLWKLPAEIAAPAALIGTSNFFELAMAVAIGLFGFDSPAALATAVGVLVEVPAMLSLVAIANRVRSRMQERAGESTPRLEIEHA